MACICPVDFVFIDLHLPVSAYLYLVHSAPPHVLDCGFHSRLGSSAIRVLSQVLAVHFSAALYFYSLLLLLFVVS